MCSYNGETVLNLTMKIFAIAIYEFTISLTNIKSTRTKYFETYFVNNQITYLGQPTLQVISSLEAIKRHFSPGYFLEIIAMQLKGNESSVAYLGEGKGGHVPRAPLSGVGGAEIDLVFERLYQPFGTTWQERS